MLDEEVPVDTSHDYDPRYRKLVDPDSQAHAVDVAVQRCLKEALV
ncbi:hypothetical protein OG331_50550 [Streptomyces sp. NBC_01017]|nr:hypothetical protein OG331_01425 [Streptomyces sp. NBC_01017]WSV35180.1 hypothetical protein OG331_50550 [Streptomyces sp. NBC_01017]